MTFLGLLAASLLTAAVAGTDCPADANAAPVSTIAGAVADASAKTKAPQGALETALRQMLATKKIAADFRVTYDDMHGMWGGTKMTLGADGAVSRKQTAQGKTTESSATADTKAMLDLVGALVEMRAWEKAPEARTASPDSSAARLVVQAGGESIAIAEDFNKLAANDRVIKAKSRLDALFAPRPEAP